VGDRVAGAIEWNLFDIDAKFGDVEALEDVLDYLERVAPFTTSDAERAVRIAQD
jgi:N-carbamoylsarcosine amidase